MAVGALIQFDAISRAAVVDAELGWPRGTCLGRLAMLYAASQDGEGTSVTKRRMILEWACVEPEHGDRFLELCCQVKESEDGEHIHFLERRDDGRYFIVGNPEQIEKLKSIRESRRLAGIASGESRRAARDSNSSGPKRTLVQQPLNTSSNKCSTSASTKREQNANPIPIPPPETKPEPVGVVVHTARTRVDPPTPPTHEMEALEVEFKASSFLSGRKPGKDGSYFACGNTAAWMLAHAEELVAGKYRDRPPRTKKKPKGFAHVPDGRDDAAAPTGFDEPPDPGDELTYEETEDATQSLADQQPLPTEADQ